MMTPQEVKTKTFPKALMGGYGMGAVDEFLDRLTEDYTALFQENTALKGKIKSLNDEIDEFKKVDSTLRATIVTAHQMADRIVAEAETKREAVIHEMENRREELLSDVEQKAKLRMEELAAQIRAEEQRLSDRRNEVNAAVAAEEQRLEKARRAVAKFLEIAKSNCQEQMKILGSLELLVPVTHRMPRSEPPKTVEAKTPAAPTPAEPEAPAAAPLQPEAPTVAEAVAETMAAAPTKPQQESHLDETAVFTIPGRREAGETEETPAAPKREQENTDKLQFELNRVKEQAKTIFSAVEVTSNTSDEGEDDATQVINLDDLQFGRNHRYR